MFEMRMTCMKGSRVAKERQQQILKDFEMRRKIQAAIVPTDSERVKQVLRSLGEPVTLFGEREVSIAQFELSN